MAMSSIPEYRQGHPSRRDHVFTVWECTQCFLYLQVVERVPCASGTLRMLGRERAMSCVLCRYSHPNPDSILARSDASHTRTSLRSSQQFAMLWSP
ncbi:hypothetical protein FA13DRAFT_1047223 [Coprinellus micaceus]|uniref:Uncharacterized protein n=1 Tax=Coprinellus micaceus TaxID=71717 RepID=A0A4Y7RML3_COPMI|nr:hypothetical protein FA13DRAFT_1047223 [Coprinellus micaceus]